tara:strand:+ start:133 stop:360 length:228 start_codon:yes stop_codon:yes gene_type:complete
MKIVKTKIKDLVLIKTNVYKDKRGFFKEVEMKKTLKKNFIFDCFSFSKKKYSQRTPSSKKEKPSKDNYRGTRGNY